ncbi:MAG: hypothetical protein IPL18_08150 [Sphingomonadales bacterium]|nr:hypothetical protein [Sphingomonadales bacterium]
MSTIDLAALADVLRKLHRLKAPYPEQSVRGGTQTDRQLFFHPDPAIQKLRAHVVGAIRAFASTLPPAKSGHPLLDYPRDQRCSTAVGLCVCWAAAIMPATPM